MTFIYTISAIPKILGFISLFLTRIGPGVFVGSLNSKSRQNMWKTICENIGDGSVTMCYMSSGTLVIKKTGKNRRWKINKQDVVLVGFDKNLENV